MSSQSSENTQTNVCSKKLDNNSFEQEGNLYCLTQNDSGRILGAVASKMRNQRDIKDYNFQQLRITAHPLLECMLKHNYDKQDTHESIYNYLRRSFTASMFSFRTAAKSGVHLYQLKCGVHLYQLKS